jgi:hypothetical protein
MKFEMPLLAVVLLSAVVSTSHAEIRIADDRGGRIGTYVDKYEDLRTSGDTVIIDGLCLSACTMVLGAVPHDRICVTSRAILGFHAAWDSGADGGRSPIATRRRCSIQCILPRYGDGSPHAAG